MDMRMKATEHPCSLKATQIFRTLERQHVCKLWLFMILAVHRLWMEEVKENQAFLNHDAKDRETWEGLWP